MALATPSSARPCSWRAGRQRRAPPAHRGAIGLSIYAVICIAGRAHCGHPSDERPWVGQGRGAHRGRAVLRRHAAFVPDAASALLGWPGAVLGGGVRAAVLAHRPGAVGVRPDGLWGARVGAGVAEAAEANVLPAGACHRESSSTRPGSVLLFFCPSSRSRRPILTFQHFDRSRGGGEAGIEDCWRTRSYLVKRGIMGLFEQPIACRA